MNTIYFDLTDKHQAEAYGRLVLTYVNRGLTFDLKHNTHDAPEGIVGVTLTGGY